MKACKSKIIFSDANAPKNNLDENLLENDFQPAEDFENSSAGAFWDDSDVVIPVSKSKFMDIPTLPNGGKRSLLKSSTDEDEFGQNFSINSNFSPNYAV